MVFLPGSLLIRQPGLKGPFMFFPLHCGTAHTMEASCLVATLYWTGCVGGGECPLPVSPWGLAQGLGL